MRGDLQAENTGWLFKSPLVGAGVYCGGRTTGRTSCFSFSSVKVAVIIYLFTGDEKRFKYKTIVKYIFLQRYSVDDVYNGLTFS